MSKVVSLPSRSDRVPPRSPYVIDGVWLITLFDDDDELIPLVRHLRRFHNVLTVGDLDAAGWNVVNSYPEAIRPEKLRAFFHGVGRKPLCPYPGYAPDGAVVTALSPARL